MEEILIQLKRIADAIEQQNEICREAHTATIQQAERSHALNQEFVQWQRERYVQAEEAQRALHDQLVADGVLAPPEKEA